MRSNRLALLAVVLGSGLLGVSATGVTSIAGGSSPTAASLHVGHHGHGDRHAGGRGH